MGEVLLCALCWGEAWALGPAIRAEGVGEDCGATGWGSRTSELRLQRERCSSTLPLPLPLEQSQLQRDLAHSAPSLPAEASLQRDLLQRDFV